MALAPLIPEEAAFGVGLFLVFMAFLFLVAMRASYSMTIGYAFSQIARLIRALPSINLGFARVGFGFLATPFEAIDNYVYHALGVGIAQTEHAWHKLILWNAYVLAKTGDEIANLTYDVLAALHIVHAKVSPAAIQAATRPFIQHYVATLPAVHVATKTAQARVVERQTVVEKRVTVIEQAVAVPAPIALPRVGPKVGELERGFDWAKGEIGKLKRYGTIAGLIGLTAAVLGRLGLGWLRCSKVARTGKQLCGMDQSLLESLLADTLLIAGTVSLVEFARGMQDVTQEVAPLIRTFWRAT